MNKYPLFRINDKVKYSIVNSKDFFIIDNVYLERPFVEILGKPLKEPHYDIIHPLVDTEGYKFVAESKLKLIEE